MTSTNNKVDTDSAEAPGKGVGCGALVRRSVVQRVNDLLLIRNVAGVSAVDICNVVAEGYEWHSVADKLPEMPVIVWVSEGGGTALLAQFDHYRWVSATSIRDLPFRPRYWQHLRLPEPSPNAEFCGPSPSADTQTEP